MKILKKAMALVLSVAAAFSLCSCKDGYLKAEEAFGESVAQAIINRDYEAFSSLIPNVDPGIAELMSLSAPDSSQRDIEAREIIMSTLTYEIDCHSDNLGTGGVININFKYVDYDSAIWSNDLDYGFVFDTEAFRDAVENCDQYIEAACSIKTSNRMGEVVCTECSGIDNVFYCYNIDFDRVGAMFSSPADGHFALEYTDLSLQLPGGFHALDIGDPLLDERFHDNIWSDKIVGCAITDDNDPYESIIIYYWSDSSYQDSSNVEVITDAMDSYNNINSYTGEEIVNVTLSQKDYTVGDHSYTAYTGHIEDASDLPESDMESIYYTYILVGNDDVCYIIYVSSENADTADELMNGLTAGVD